jgi:hypothetical protein
MREQELALQFYFCAGCESRTSHVAKKRFEFTTSTTVLVHELKSKKKYIIFLCSTRSNINKSVKSLAYVYGYVSFRHCSSRKDPPLPRLQLLKLLLACRLIQ